MTAKILIKRDFKEGNTPQIVNIMNDMRALALTYPGYLSGETLVERGSPHSMVVISTWQSMEEWLTWKESPGRNKFEAMLEVYQEGPTIIKEYILGSPLHKD
ncbi:MAG: antibiotic biosynthesis monooxygenase [Desulfobacteraceae bacterium]|jgi:heme-degrading monooxygenase HmoA